MTPSRDQTLSRRERQIMDILYRLGEATVSEVVDGLEDRRVRVAPAYKAAIGEDPQVAPD